MEEIQIEMLQFCERCEKLPGGGVNIFNLTDTFRFAEYPANQTVALVCRFRLQAKAHATGRLGFELFDPDGARIWYQNGTIDMFYQPSREDPATISSVLTCGLNNFRFEKAGDYLARAVWNTQVLLTAPLFMLYPRSPDDKPGYAEVIDGR